MTVLKTPSWTALCLLMACCFSSCASRRPQTAQTPQTNPSELVEQLTQLQPATPVVKPEPTEKKPTPPQQVTPQLPATGKWEQQLAATLDSLCCNDSLFTTSQIGICVLDLTQGIPLFEKNAQQRMRPASCQKLVTAITSLHCVGPQYALRTGLYTSGRVNNGTLQGNIYVVGGMDPLLSAAEVNHMVQALRNTGIRRINGKMCKDVSMTDGKPYGWGWCWDDDYGPLSALLVDGKDNFTAVWKRSMAQHGITVSGPDTLVNAVCPADASPIFTVRHDLDALLTPMMKESDNIYAECLFYQIAANGGRRQAGRKDAAEQVYHLMEQAGIDTEACCVADGSGLSLYNYLTPHILTNFLKLAHSRPEVYQALFHTLPVAGVDGTLKKRMRHTPAFGKVWAKTGSVTGISSLSGYVQAANGHLLAFSIINQGVTRTAHGRAFQDKACCIMCR